MVKTWLAAALGSIFMAGAASGATLPNERRPDTSGTTTRPSVAVDLQCVKNAVGVREAALSNAASAQSQTVSAAYATRAAALSAAYGNTDATLARNQSKAAWSAFSTTVKNAKATFKKGRENAWSAFRTAVKACKGGESVSDSGNASSEE